MRLGSDTGGTFTDLVDDRGVVVKVPSTPVDPAEAVRSGAARFPRTPAVLCHGTTVATNALLEGDTARTALLTDAGFADLLEIGRQDRPALYDPRARRPSPLVRPGDRHEIGGRIRADGAVAEPFDPATLPRLDDGVEAVVVGLLHSDLNADHELAAVAALADRGVTATASHRITPEFREFERLATAVMSAALGPACRGYLNQLSELAPRVLVLTSAGGLATVERAAANPAALLLSGPAGGVSAAAAAAAEAGYPDAVSFDMGGTSTDVCLIEAGRPAPAAERSVAGRPVRLPALDIHTIGAGGGSIAWLDAGGALRVGPRSAGAVPGPACYGLGGERPTVTDADLVAGRIAADRGFDALGDLDLDAARVALASLGVGPPEQAAEDVIRVVDASMVAAIRAVTVERGVDPASLALVAFGGAGPLHACALAATLGMRAVVVPARAGVFSAVGVLAGPEQHDLVRSVPDREPDTADALLTDLAAEATAALPDGDGPVDVTTAIDARYAGQSHELTVTDLDGFAAEHERRNGFARPGTAIEVVAVRARATRAAPLGPGDLPVAERELRDGPAVLTEPDATVFVPEGWRARASRGGSLVLERR